MGYAFDIFFRFFNGFCRWVWLDGHFSMNKCNTFYFTGGSQGCCPWGCQLLLATLR
jgi:hypothetical protein